MHNYDRIPVVDMTIKPLLTQSLACVQLSYMFVNNNSNNKGILIIHYKGEICILHVHKRISMVDMTIQLCLSANSIIFTCL